jgi:UDP-glucose 4-epimerase
VVAIFIERLLAGRTAVINGDGAQTRDYVHVDDVVAANLRAVETASLGAYNIGTGCECDVNALYAHIARAAGVDHAPAHGQAKPGEQRRSCVDVSRAAALLDWRPSIPLEHGISGTLAWFAARRGRE